MANVLPVQTQHAILALHAQGRSIRRIARELGIHRNTVSGYLEGVPPDPKCTTLSTPGSPPNCTISTPGKTGRKSLCDPHADWIGARLDSGLSAQRIFQDLRSEFAFAGSYQAVKRFVHRLKATQPERVWRVEVGPGEEAQVDFGTGAPIVQPDGSRRRSWVLRVVLSHSRRGYSEAVLRQDTESFLRCVENAFRHFGGVPRTLNLDNLKAAVLHFDWADPDLNPKFRDFARHYGVALMPCKPRTPEHKGKVERGIGYVKNNALAGRSFGSIAGENEALRHWEATVADVRIHGTTKRQVLQRFAGEQPHLLPLPHSLFPCFREAQRTVHRDGFVEIDKAYYEAKAEYIGTRIWARWDAREVRLFNDRLEPIRVHRRLEPGQFTRTLGIGGGHGSIQSNLDYWLARAADLGPSCAEWGRELARQRGFESIRSLMGLARLLDTSSHRLLNQACAEATRRGAWRLRDVRALLGARESQPHFAFAESHPLIRDLNEYGIFIKTHCQT